MTYPYHIYSITFSDTFDTYVGITRDIDMSRSFHDDCMRDPGCTSILYEYMRLHPSWDLKLVSSHDTYEEAKDKKVFGSLNVYDDRINLPTIYKIYCRDPNVHEMYVGQTINYESRKCSHFFSSMHKNLKLYEFIRSHGGWSNWKMEKICDYPNCSPHDNTELDKLEWYWWVQLGGSLNSVIPGNSPNLLRKYGGQEGLLKKMVEFERMVINGIPRKDDFFFRNISLEI